MESSLLQKQISTVAFPRRKLARTIDGLKWAYWSKKSPHHTSRKLTGAAAKGQTYERKFRKELNSILDADEWQGHFLHTEKWIRFEDDNGLGWAQPDFTIVVPEAILILDTKLTHTPSTYQQIGELYSPLLSHMIDDRPQVWVEVCHNLGSVNGESPNFIESLSDVFESDRDLYIMHWLGF